MTVWVQDPYSQPKPIMSGTNIYVKENASNVEFDLTVISGLVAGEYGNATVTVDNKGRVTAIQTGTGGSGVVSGSGVTQIIINSGTSLEINPGIISARISLKSNIYFSDTDIYSGTSLYYVPYYGNNIPLYNTGTGLWETNSLNSQLTYNMSGIRSGTNFDVFVFKSGTSLHLELTQWTDDTTRVAITTISGVPVKVGETNKRLVGSIRTTAAGMSDDAPVRRFVSNLYNRKKLKLYKKESTDSWTYDSSTWRYVNNDSNNKVEIINCIDDIYLKIIASLVGQRSAVNGTAVTGIGVNTIASETSDIQDGIYLETIQNALKTRAELEHYPSLGLSYYAWMEKRVAAGSLNFIGDAADESQFKSAIFGTVEM